jgi:hypothetical protein
MVRPSDLKMLLSEPIVVDRLAALTIKRYDYGSFALPFTPAPDKDGRDLAKGPIKIGLNLSALLYRRDLPTGDRIKQTVDYPALIDALLKTPGIPREILNSVIG